jgi:hypothetical protein
MVCLFVCLREGVDARFANLNSIYQVRMLPKPEGLSTSNKSTGLFLPQEQSGICASNVENSEVILNIHFVPNRFSQITSHM